MTSSTVATVRDYVSERVDAGLTWVTAARRATYGTSLVRLAFGVGAVVYLLVNFQNRHYLWGDAARWVSPRDANGGFGWPFTFFAGGSGATELTVKYLLLFVVACLFTVGWHTRWMAPAMLLLWTSLLESNPLTGDQSDNIFRILLFYFCFADIAGRWSLDARRRARRLATYGAPRPLGRLGSPTLNSRVSEAGTLVHNFAVITAGAQICMIYVASGLYKAQGARWQDGTAIFYPMQLSHYRPWPALNDLLVSNSFMVAAVTYFAVFIQLFFPLLLLRRTTRIIAIVGVLAMHAGIGLFMGLPFFSLFIMAGDCIFVRDSTFRGMEERVRQRFGRDRRPAGMADGPTARRTAAPETAGSRG
ncbi:HTTM domain-containing protein [Oerskovia flava]|uniref:HTTM domain-containing protein n=1 Tax=Oerskovia flava TaxID=2986422 RepID=UPI00223F5EC7|nr:HTTM domain-containing protein [Oerskovia sp. JB1-3-2]